MIVGSQIPSINQKQQCWFIPLARECSICRVQTQIELFRTISAPSNSQEHHSCSTKPLNSSSLSDAREKLEWNSPIEHFSCLNRLNYSMEHVYLIIGYIR